MALALGGCGDDEEPREAPSEVVETTTTSPSADVTPPAEGRPTTVQLEPPPCPDDLEGCDTAAGTILYVERVDPDGDGDAHFVLLSRDGITAPGISTIDVAPELRPSPLPGPGDLLAAAGPVLEGSYGQRQIQAEALEFKRVR